MYNVTRILNAQEIQPEILDKGIAKKKEEEGFPVDKKSKNIHTLGVKNRR